MDVLMKGGKVQRGIKGVRGRRRTRRRRVENLIFKPTTLYYALETGISVNLTHSSIVNLN